MPSENKLDQFDKGELINLSPQTISSVYPTLYFYNEVMAIGSSKFILAQ